MPRVIEITLFSHSDVWYKPLLRFWTCNCKILCTELLSFGWLLRKLRKNAGVHVFLLKWTVSVCREFSELLLLCFLFLLCSVLWFNPLRCFSNSKCFIRNVKTTTKKRNTLTRIPSLLTLWWFNQFTLSCKKKHTMQNVLLNLHR